MEWDGRVQLIYWDQFDSLFQPGTLEPTWNANKVRSRLHSMNPFFFIPGSLVSMMAGVKEVPLKIGQAINILGLPVVCFFIKCMPY